MNSNSINISGRRLWYVLIASIMVITVALPALVSAAQVTNRSIALTSSSVEAENVTYTVNFTAAEEAGAFVVDFCDNSPVIGQPCDEPAGFDLTDASSSTGGFTDVNALDANTVVVAGTVSGEVSVALDGITNPDAAGPLYARIVTFDTDTNADLYTSTTPGSDSAVIDDGGVAISITPTIGVSGAVLESMTFCVSGAVDEETQESPILANCTGALTAPTLALGEQVGQTDVVALNAESVSQGSIYTQISTNAASGAVIWLKSSALDCGGLMRAGAEVGTCDIAPAAGGITAGEAEFGVKTSPATPTADANASGVLQPVAGSGYNVDAFTMNFAEGNATGVTSTFGDQFLDTAGDPVNNQNMTLTFGASVSNDTPAGSYSADLSLVATGKF